MYIKYQHCYIKEHKCRTGIDYSRDQRRCHQSRIKVELLSFVRPEQKFGSVTELAKQVECDKESAKTWLAKCGIIVNR